MALAPKKGRAGKITLNKQQHSQIKEMAEIGLKTDQIASILGFTKPTFYKILARDEDALLAYNLGKANGANMAVTKLMEHIDKGSEKSLHFLLKFMFKFNGSDDFDVLQELEEQRKADKTNGAKLPSKIQFTLVD